MEVSSLNLIDLVEDDVDERPVHYQIGLDTAFLNFAGVVLEYVPPDRVVPYSKAHGFGPVPRRERIRLVSARLFDLEERVAQMTYDTAGIMVRPHPPKRVNVFDLPSMAQACGKLFADWKALFAQSSPPIAMAVENPKKQTAAGGGWQGPPNQYAVSSIAFAILGALDKAKGLPQRFVEYRQSKAEVKRGTPYAQHKEEAIERTKQIMKRNRDEGGLALLEEMTTKHYKIDDVADAYLLAVNAARVACRVSTKQLARVAERLRQAEAGEDLATQPTATKKRKRTSVVMEDGEPTAKRSKKE